MGTEVIDVNGDNLPDLIQLFIPPSGYYGGQPQRRVFRNTGDGFVYDHEYSSSLPDTYFADGNGSMGTRLMDLTGDGRPELIQMYIPPSGYYGGQPQRRVFRNTGSGFTFDHNNSGSLPDTYFGMGTELMDLNGDGLPEIIQLAVPPGGFYGGVPQRRVFRNTGLGFSYDHAYTVSLPDTYFEDGSGSMGTRFADVNGDGLPDLMQMYIPANGYYGGQPQRRVFRNTGLNFEYMTGYSASLPDTYFGMGSESLDLNGDGLSDLIQLLIPPSGYYGGNVQAKVYTGNPQKQDTLINIQSNSGIRMTISYKAASQFEGAICPVQCPNSLPTSVSSQPANFARLLVSSVSSTGILDTDRISGLELKTQLFEYFDGRLSGGSPVEQALLGFRTIKITDENSGNYVITTYRQDKPFHGTPIVTRSYLANGTLLSEQQSPPLAQYVCNTSGCTLDATNAAHPAFPRQIRQNGPAISRTFEADNLKFIKTEQVLAYDTYGNALRARARQETGANVQETFVFRQFINNITPTRAIGMPFYEKTCLSESECTEGDANFVGAARYYYDNLPLGQVGQRHLVTRRETFGPTEFGGGWLAETFAYNAQGLPEDHRAVDGTRTETAYDGNYP